MKRIRSMTRLAAICVLLTFGMMHFAAAQTDAIATKASASDVARGRYMVVTGHCNNCHTASYAARQGNVPEQEWLLGNPVGFRLAAGTSYASNLRLTVQNFTEEQWVRYAKSAKTRPPMPWWSLHETSEQDLLAMYRYMKHLGPAGQPVPLFVPPDKEPPRPFETRQIVP
ncbi:MAG TPA: cytochrome C [Burkholderiales bacterium]|nr:cytochrome C [Burkholderiales bacterium]